MPKKIGSYAFIRVFFEFALNWPPCKCQHIALYNWIVELNNRLKWRENFGLPTSETMEGLSIGNKNTYYKALRDLEKWQFIKIIKTSKNQYQSCIIFLCRDINATALLKNAGSLLNSHCSSIDTGTVPIYNIEDSILQKGKNIKKNKEREQNAPPDFNLVFLFLKKESNWGDEKCQLIAKKFLITYEGNHTVNSNWEKKAKVWILTDKEKTTQKSNDHILPQKIAPLPKSIHPEFWSDMYAKKLSPVGYDDYLERLKNLGKIPIYSEDGKIIDFKYQREIDIQNSRTIVMEKTDRKLNYTEIVAKIGKEK